MFSDTTHHHSASGIDSAPIKDPHDGPDIRQTVKRPKQTKIRESPAGHQSNGNAISIHLIPDSVLLEIFDSCLVEGGCCSSDDEDDEDIAPLSGWQLAHVCQRWRYLIFASPSRFDLELVCSPGTPVRKTLSSWPAFPIVIDYGEVASKDKNNVIAALGHPGRVRRITLSGVTRTLWEKLDAAMQEPFPALTRLSLTGPRDEDERSPVLPHKLLGGGTLRLQELNLRGMSYPGLPQFLLSARDIVKLDFVQIPSTCYVSPEEILNGLAGLTRLESLAIEFQPSILLNLLRRKTRDSRNTSRPSSRSEIFSVQRFFRVFGGSRGSNRCSSPH